MKFAVEYKIDFMNLLSIQGLLFPLLLAFSFFFNAALNPKIDCLTNCDNIHISIEEFSYHYYNRIDFFFWLCWRCYSVPCIYLFMKKNSFSLQFSNFSYLLATNSKLLSNNCFFHFSSICKLTWLLSDFLIKTFSYIFER